MNELLWERWIMGMLLAIIFSVCSVPQRAKHFFCACHLNLVSLWGKHNFLHFMEIGNKLRTIKSLVQVKQLVIKWILFFFLPCSNRGMSALMSPVPRSTGLAKAAWQAWGKHSLALICPLLALYSVAGRAQKQIWLPCRDLQDRGAAANSCLWASEPLCLCAFVFKMRTIISSQITAQRLGENWIRTALVGLCVYTNMNICLLMWQAMTSLWWRA